mgnify:CR=1 FL=1
MKRRLLLVVTLLAGWNLLSAQSLPDRKETLKTLVKVNDYFNEKVLLILPDQVMVGNSDPVISGLAGYIMKG